MKKQELTGRQQELLDFIRESITGKGFPPSVKDIQVRFNFKSPNAAQELVAVLAKKGHIIRHPGISRGIELIKVVEATIGNDFASIPLVGQIAAGTPITAVENVEYNISIDKSLFGDTEKMFALKVKGDSMIDAGILDGDIAIINKQPSVQNGEIAAVILKNDEATLKRIYIGKDSVRLEPENRQMKPIIVKKGEEISIVGKLKGVIRKI